MSIMIAARGTSPLRVAPAGVRATSPPRASLPSPGIRWNQSLPEPFSFTTSRPTSPPSLTAYNPASFVFHAASSAQSSNCAPVRSLASAAPSNTVAEAELGDLYVGQSVAVWSKSYSQWFDDGVVTAIEDDEDDDTLVSVMYGGGRTKTMPYEDAPLYFKVPSIVTKSGLGHIHVGQAVAVWGKNHSRWFDDGYVTAVEDGEDDEEDHTLISVTYGGGRTKTFLHTEVPEILRVRNVGNTSRCLNSNDEIPYTATPRAERDDASPFPIGLAGTGFRWNPSLPPIRPVAAVQDGRATSPLPSRQAGVAFHWTQPSLPPRAAASGNVVRAASPLPSARSFSSVSWNPPRREM